MFLKKIQSGEHNIPRCYNITDVQFRPTTCIQKCLSNLQILKQFWQRKPYRNEQSLGYRITKDQSLIKMHLLVQLPKQQEIIKFSS